MYRKSYCTTPGVGVGVGGGGSRSGVGMDKMLKFFKVMGKALSGELSCTGTGLVITVQWILFTMTVFVPKKVDSKLDLLL